MIKQAGNTLVELLMATMIVGIVLTGIAISLTYSIQREAINRYRDGATDLAAEITEYIQLKRAQEGWSDFYANLATGNYCYDPTTPTLTNTGGGNCLTPIQKVGMDYYGTVKIDKIVGVPPTPNSIQAAITLRWDVDADTKTYEVQQNYFEREF